ncbi:hypothetical protein [Herbaspirillum sp. alder98]|uniref:hypothetical protein n=1 Tax=Herbaspirillum sp. alder98 TaxID=2913096 RepID=UPI001CD909EF|nr:hypothetical protein [Herbaspirillum sp. alder98]MCA1325395.1 hypothetical protein [Herbaspirillum sp. alder98]
MKCKTGLRKAGFSIHLDYLACSLGLMERFFQVLQRFDCRDQQANVVTAVNQFLFQAIVHGFSNDQHHAGSCTAKAASSAAMVMLGQA